MTEAAAEEANKERCADGKRIAGNKDEDEEEDDEEDDEKDEEDEDEEDEEG